MVHTVELLSVSFDTNNSGTMEPKISRRKTVLCSFRSVGMRESYQAMAINRKPEIVAVLSDYYDYEDEQYAVIATKVYKVMRTYVTDKRIELTLERTSDLGGMV